MDGTWLNDHQDYDRELYQIRLLMTCIMLLKMEH